MSRHTKFVVNNYKRELFSHAELYIGIISASALFGLDLFFLLSK